MWKNMVEQGRPQITIYQAHTLCMPVKQGHRRPLRISNTHCSFTAKNGFANAPQYYVCTYVACLVSSREVNICIVLHRTANPSLDPYFTISLAPNTLCAYAECVTLHSPNTTRQALHFWQHNDSSFSSSKLTLRLLMSHIYIYIYIYIWNTYS